MPQIISLHHVQPGRVVLGHQVSIRIQVAHVEHLDIFQSQLAADLEMNGHIVQFAKQSGKGGVLVISIVGLKQAGLAEDQHAVLVNCGLDRLLDLGGDGLGEVDALDFGAEGLVKGDDGDLGSGRRHRG